MAETGQRSGIILGSHCRRNYADRHVLGNNFSGESVLAKFDALLATLLPARPALAMPSLDGLSVTAIVMVVINVAVLGRVFRRICMIRVYLCHCRCTCRHYTLLFMNEESFAYRGAQVNVFHDKGTSGAPARSC